MFNICQHNVYIRESVYQSIKNTLGTYEPEKGGLLGSKNGIISSFYYDEHALTGDNTYIPNIDKVNEILLKWESEEVTFAGIIHSHPYLKKNLSFADIDFAKRIIEINCSDLYTVHFPIVIPKHVEIYWYVVIKEGDTYRVDHKNIKIIHKKIGGKL